MLVRGPALSSTMSSALIDQLGKLPNVAIQTGTEVAGVEGDRHLEAETVSDRVAAEKRAV